MSFLLQFLLVATFHLTIKQKYFKGLLIVRQFSLFISTFLTIEKSIDFSFYFLQTQFLSLINKTLVLFYIM